LTVRSTVCYTVVVVDRSQWLRGVTELLVLAVLQPRASYGYELVERLSALGIDDLSEATVYGTLRRLEAQGLLVSRLAASQSGPARRYYEVTTKGTRWRRETAQEWSAFASTVDRIVATAERKRGAS